MGECYQVRGCVTCVDVEACGGTPLAVAVPIVDCGGTPLAITEVEAPGWTVAAHIRVNAHSATPPAAPPSGAGGSAGSPWAGGSAGSDMS